MYKERHAHVSFPTLQKKKTENHQKARIPNLEMKKHQRNLKTQPLKSVFKTRTV
jgi:hypothetical protein